MVILLHADDAGIGEQATNMILDAWQQNMLHGFGIVAHTTCSKIIAQALEQHPHLPCTLSAHLNLTDGLSFKTYTSSSVITDAGRHLHISFLKAFFLLLRGGNVRKQFLQEVYDEWDAQLQHIQQLTGSRRLTAVNGHNHIHMLPPLFEVATQLAEKYQIPHIRFVNETFFLASWKDLLRRSFYINLIKLAVLTLCKWKIKIKNRQVTPLSNETFGVLYSNSITTEILKKAIDCAGKRNVHSFEIIVHPGQSAPAEMDQWATFAASKLFFTDDKRRKEWEALKQLQHELRSKH